MSSWKYMKGGQQYGPVDTEALAAMLRDGTLAPDTTVLKEGAFDWVAARNVPELASAAGAAPTTPAAGVPPVGGTAMADPADVEKNKIFAVLAYIWILFLVPLLAAKDSKFARYHTNQGLVLFLFGIAAMIPSFIPLVGCITGPVAFICILVFMVMGIINAINGQYKPLPLIGQFTLIK